MNQFLINRILSACLVIVLVTSLVFLIIHLIPGDPVDVMLGESAQLTDRAALRQQLGLDQSIYQQWFNFVRATLQFDFGHSLHSKTAIRDLLLQRLPATLELAAAALLVAVLLALPLGMMAAVEKDSLVDRGAMMFSLLGVSIPNFLLGPILMLIFAVGVGWFPVSGRESATSIVLPALTLGSGMAAILSRMVRASLLDVLLQDYIRTARAKGLTSLTILMRHAMRNAALPIITLLGLQFGALLAGAVITEVIFSWPGIGSLTIDAIQTRDYPVVQACILFISVTYVLVNTFTDILYAYFDPRIRYQVVR